MSPSVLGLLNEWLPAYARLHISAERWQVFRDIVSRFERSGVELSFFVAPMSAYELERIVQSGRWDSFLE